MTTTVAPVQVPRAAGARPERTADHTLDAAAYVCEGLAGYVLGKFHHGPPVSWAPSPSIDVVGLVRHATVAYRVRQLRDTVLCLLGIAALAVPTIQIGLLLAPAAAAFLATALVLGWAFWVYRDRRDRADEARTRLRGARRALVALATCGVIVLAATSDPHLLATAVALVGAIVLAWSIAVVELLWAQHRARAILAYEGPPGDLAPALRPSVEERIARLSTMNVVVHRAARASAPFVGNGFRVRPWSIDVDVFRGATGEDGREKPPQEVDVEKLYEFLTEQFGLEASLETTGSRRLRTGHRLYVDGSHIPWSSDLLAGDPPLPRERLEWSEVVELVRYPERAYYQRVYFYVEEIDRDGEIAVALFVRPHLRGQHLFVEMVPHVVPPINRDVERLMAGLPDHLFDRVVAALRSRTPATLRLIRESPVECARTMWAGLCRHRARRAWRRAAARRRPYDFGAAISLREGLSTSDPKALSHFVVADVSRINTYLQGKVVGYLKEFLRRLDIDTEQLDTSEKKTVNNNWNVGDVRADMVGFGNGNTFWNNPTRDEPEDHT